MSLKTSSNTVVDRTLSSSNIEGRDLVDTFPPVVPSSDSTSECDDDDDNTNYTDIDADTQSTSSFLFTRGSFSRSSTFTRRYTTTLSTESPYDSLHRSTGDIKYTETAVVVDNDKYDIEQSDDDDDNTKRTVKRDPPSGSSRGQTTAIIEETIEITMKEVDPSESNEYAPKYASLFPSYSTNAKTSNNNNVESINNNATSRESRANFRQNVLFDESSDGHVDIYDLNFGEESFRIPFPELGVDLVDIAHPAFVSSTFNTSSSVEETINTTSKTTNNYNIIHTNRENGMSDKTNESENNDKPEKVDKSSFSSSFRLTDVSLWEENWLFRKKKQNKSCNNSYFAFADLGFASEPPLLFIPNPCQPTRTFVGDQDVDTLDELSERNSVASLVFSSSDEEEREESESESAPGDRVVPSLYNSNLSQSQHSNFSSSKLTLNFLTRSNVESSLKSEVMTQGLGDKNESMSSNMKNCSAAVIDVAQVTTMSEKSAHNVEKVVKSHERDIKYDNCGNRNSAMVINRVNNHNDITKNSSNNIHQTSDGVISCQRKGEEKVMSSPFSSSTYSPSPSSLSSSLSSSKPSFIIQTSTLESKHKSCGSVRSLCFSADTNNSTSKVSLPTFVPISKRMESSRSDPSFVIKPYGPNKPVQTNILIQIVCRVRGSKPLGVAWFKGDTLLSDNDEYRIFSNGNEHVLEIRDTRIDHTGRYSCVVYNGFGEQWSDFYLTISPIRVHSPNLRISPKTIADAKNNATTIKLSPSDKPTTIPPSTSSNAVSRGINVDSLTKGSARVITRTWAERTLNPKPQKQDKVRRVGTFTMKKESDVHSSSSTPESGSSLRPNRNIDEYDHQRPVVYSSLSRNRGKQESVDSLPTRVASKPKETVTVVIKTEQNDYDNGNRDGIYRLSSKCHDLSVYSRDYFVPSVTTRVKTKNMSLTSEELLNAVEEKVCDYGKRFSPDDERRLSVTESISIQSSKSSREEGIESDDEGDRGSDDLPRTPSVKKLVRKFSRRDPPMRSPTFRSTHSIHDKCNGRGVIPRSISSGIEVHSLTARSLGRFYKSRFTSPSNLDKPTSVSMYNIHRVPESISPKSSENGNGSEPITEGYTSDDSALSSTTKIASSPVQVMTNKIGRKMNKRASFWQNRCERGLMSDRQVNEDFPELEVVLFD